MNYYYDLELNFEDTLICFYEWDTKDTLTNFKKIPIFLISDEEFSKLYNYNFKVDETFLELIKNKSKVKPNIEYVTLFASNLGVLGIIFNKEGISIKRSALKIEDEVSILESLYTFKKAKIKYKLLKEIKYNNTLRKDIHIKNTILKEIDYLIENKCYDKLKYLYLEWFYKDYKTIEEAKQNINNSLENITDREIKIYNLIKLSYNSIK